MYSVKEDCPNDIVYLGKEHYQHVVDAELFYFSFEELNLSSSIAAQQNTVCKDKMFQTYLVLGNLKRVIKFV